MGRQSLATRSARSKQPTPGQLVKDRDAAIELMNPALRKKFEQIEKADADHRTHNLRFYHRLGKLLLEVQDNPERYERNAIRLLQAALFTQRRTLRKAARFAEMYDDEQLEELLECNNDKANFRLHWGHVSFLLTVPTPAQRKQWAERAVRNLWDPDALHEAMKKKRGTAPGIHGRHHTLPKSIPAQVRQIKTESRKWLGKSQTAWDGTKLNAFQNILDAAPDEYTDDLMEDLIEIKATMNGIVDAARSNVEKVDELIQHVETTMQEQERADAAAEAAASDTGKEARSIDLDSGTRRGRRRRAG